MVEGRAEGKCESVAMGESEGSRNMSDETTKRDEDLRSIDAIQAAAVHAVDGAWHPDVDLSRVHRDGAAVMITDGMAAVRIPDAPAEATRALDKIKRPPMEMARMNCGKVLASVLVNPFRLKAIVDLVTTANDRDGKWRDNEHPTPIKLDILECRDGYGAIGLRFHVELNRVGEALLMGCSPTDESDKL